MSISPGSVAALLISSPNTSFTDMRHLIGTPCLLHYRFHRQTLHRIIMNTLICFDGTDLFEIFFSLSCALSPITPSPPSRYQSNLLLSVTSLSLIRKERVMLLSRNGCSSLTTLTQTQVPLLHLYKNSS